MVLLSNEYIASLCIISMGLQRLLLAIIRWLWLFRALNISVSSIHCFGAKPWGVWPAREGPVTYGGVISYHTKHHEPYNTSPATCHTPCPQKIIIIRSLSGKLWYLQYNRVWDNNLLPKQWYIANSHKWHRQLSWGFSIINFQIHYFLHRQAPRDISSMLLGPSYSISSFCVSLLYISMPMPL